MAKCGRARGIKILVEKFVKYVFSEELGKYIYYRMIPSEHGGSAGNVDAELGGTGAERGVEEMGDAGVGTGAEDVEDEV